MDKTNEIKKTTVSVIVPCYNSEKTIAACISSILRQETDENYEIIVVDSSTDSTPIIIKHKFQNVIFIHLTTQTYPGAARNIGVKNAKGKIIAFIDSDCVAAPDWLQKGLDALNKGYSFVGGSVKNANPGFISTADYILTFNEFFPTMPSREVAFMPTCNFMCTKDAFNMIGGFDSSLLAGEDTIFCYKARKKHLLFFNANMDIAHHNRLILKMFLIHHYLFGKYSAVIRKKIVLPGSFLARNPLLALMAPPCRFLKIFSLFLTKNRRLLMVFLLNLPLITSGILAWGWGFLSGSFNEHKVYKFPVVPKTEKYKR